MYVGGTSAGGHLTACVMATQWSEFPDVDPTLLKGNFLDQHTVVVFVSDRGVIISLWKLFV